MAPGTQAAIEWLIGPNSSGAWRRRRAVQRLIVKKDGESWHVNDHALKRMVKSAIRRSSILPENLGILLCGLGELAVRGQYGPIRSEYDIVPLMRNWLVRHRCQTRWQPILTQAATLNLKQQKKIGPRGLQKEAYSFEIVKRLLSHHTLTPELWSATQPLRYEELIQRSMRYGLMFVARMALALDPVGLMHWVRNGTDQTAKWVVIEMLGDIVRWSGISADRQAAYLLAMKDPLGIALAARMLIDPPVSGPAPPLAESWRRLLGAGVSEEDACWLCSPAICVADDRCQDASRRFEHLERQRNRYGAPGPATLALNAEIDAELATATAHKADTASAAAASRKTFADMLRHTPIGQEKWELIVQELPKQHRLRHELALAIKDGEARRRLLDCNLKDLLTEIGGDRPKVALREWFSSKKETFFDLADGAVQALIVLAADMSKNIGQLTSQKIGSLAEAADKALAEPYLHARHYTRWESALGRYACAVIFAFHVADTLDKGRRSEVTKLVDLALNHARRILSQVPEPFAPHAWWFQYLSSRTVRWLDIQGSPGDLEALAQDKTQPFLLRSMALWVRPGLAASHIDLALECFKRANIRWPGEMAIPDRAIRAVYSLDLAVGYCGADEIADRLVPIWNDIFASWRDALAQNLRTLPTSLIGAIRGVEPYRSRFLGDKRFSQSFCRLTIEHGGASEAGNEDA